MINIRPEQPDDIPLIHAINEVAFGQPTEANIVDALRTDCQDVVSLVAVSDGQIVGHILFTPVIVSDSAHKVKGMGLAPMAVLPEYQSQGIGSTYPWHAKMPFCDRSRPHGVLSPLRFCTRISVRPRLPVGCRS